MVCLFPVEKLMSDSYDTRRYMKSIFAPFCRVVEARDGQEALDMCKKSVPDLIITDVMMPIVRLLLFIKDDCLPPARRVWSAERFEAGQTAGNVAYHHAVSPFHLKGI
jgi:CheY-like chemotaxis protein